MIIRAVLYAALFSLSVASFAQEIVTGLYRNPAIESAGRRMFRIMAPDTAQIPFTDDFSAGSVIPGKCWSDDFVFINNTFSERHITCGVATFDALDNYGQLYEDASSTGFPADRLTSVPINLNYPASSNIFLSFMYEAGGLSDSPEKADSLTLQFFAPADNKWQSVWSAEGSTAKGFRNVIIPVNDPRYLKKGFRLRFINYASLSTSATDPSMAGNCDIWNIDYLRLDKNRNAGDTVYADVAFRLPVRSVLTKNESMPWKQYRKMYWQENPSISVTYRNNDTIRRNITRDFEIFDVYRDVRSHLFTAGAINIDPLSEGNYRADLIYDFNTDNADSALFRITCSLKTDEFDPKMNDTLIYYQVFGNYFSFDDGSSEGGYGINGLGSRNAMLACRFRTFVQDTVRAIDICFNDSYLDANKRAFDLMIWDDNNGIPGNVLYQREEIMVEQAPSINGFYRYYIPGGVKIENDFYVGWKQRSETFMNAGYDLNTPPSGRQLYWINGGWNQSQVKGSVMIRPVVGNAEITGIDDEFGATDNSLKVWPNPAGDEISLSMEGDQFIFPVDITIMDLSGHSLLKVPFRDRIDISSLGYGMYIVISSINGKPVGYTRLVKSR